MYDDMYDLGSDYALVAFVTHSRILRFVDPRGCRIFFWIGEVVQWPLTKCGLGGGPMYNPPPPKAQVEGSLSPPSV